MQAVRWCTTCLAMSTRPRISFDDAGRCNACVWAERKSLIDWSVREAELNFQRSSIRPSPSSDRAMSGEVSLSVPRAF